MDRFHLENPGVSVPDEETEDQRLIAETGNQHELNVLTELRASDSGLREIEKNDFASALADTIAASHSKASIVFQAALEHDGFAGYADFLMLGADGQYQVWDTKLARSPKPYYAIQLCCYSEMLAAAAGKDASHYDGSYGISGGAKWFALARADAAAGLDAAALALPLAGFGAAGRRAATQTAKSGGKACMPSVSWAAGRVWLPFGKARVSCPSIAVPRWGRALGR